MPVDEGDSVNGAARSCATCAYWESDLADTGICRRYPPAWPRTLRGEWCGEYQPGGPHENDVLDDQQERGLRNASMAQALMVLPPEKRDKLLDAILTEEERESPSPPADFYERVHDYLAAENEGG